MFGMVGGCSLSTPLIAEDVLAALPSALSQPFVNVGMWTLVTWQVLCKINVDSALAY